MKLLPISISFVRYSDDGFLTKAEFILECMTGNPDFTDPVPPLAEIGAAIIKYGKALVAASSKDHLLLAAKKDCRRHLEQLLGQLGLYVMYVAKGNQLILANSGFTLAKAREPQYITNPGNVTLKNGITSGDLMTSAKKGKGVKNVFHQISDTFPTEATVWDSRSTTRSKYLFKNLTAGKQYWARIVFTGVGDQVAYSPVATIFVQ